MAICYNIVYNTSTSAFEKHGGTVSGFGTSALHDCGFFVDITEPNNTLLNTSADSIVISANNLLADSLTSASQVTSGYINTDIYEGVDEMKVTLSIVVKTPIVKPVYNPLPKTEKENVVRRY